MLTNINCIITRIHRIGQTRAEFVKRLIIKDSIEERILGNRRSLAADRPTGSSQLDDSLLDDVGMQAKSRIRREDETEMQEKTSVGGTLWLHCHCQRSVEGMMVRHANIGNLIQGRSCPLFVESKYITKTLCN